MAVVSKPMETVSGRRLLVLLLICILWHIF
jgi:hypothetical protein